MHLEDLEKKCYEAGYNCFDECKVIYHGRRAMWEAKITVKPKLARLDLDPKPMVFTATGHERLNTLNLAATMAAMKMGFQEPPCETPSTSTGSKS